MTDIYNRKTFIVKSTGQMLPNKASRLHP
jgi:hypothetical protein